MCRSVIVATLLLLMLGLRPSFGGDDREHRIFLGMTATELQSVMGPPDKLKTLGVRDAFFYCPRSLFGIPLGNDYATVWLFERRVIGARFHHNRNLGTCEEFVQAFSWSDEPFPILVHRGGLCSGLKC